MKCLVALTTFPSFKSAKKYSEELVKAKLAACVNIIPRSHSIYIWQGKLCSSNECLLVIKSLTKFSKKLEAHLLRNHPYNTPELIYCQPKHVTRKYKEWMGALLS